MILGRQNPGFKKKSVLLPLAAERRASAARKVAMVLSANHTARALALTGLRERYPGEPPTRLRRRLADLWLGPELAAKAYGPLN